MALGSCKGLCFAETKKRPAYFYKNEKTGEITYGKYCYACEYAIVTKDIRCYCCNCQYRVRPHTNVIRSAKTNERYEVGSRMKCIQAIMKHEGRERL